MQAVGPARRHTWPPHLHDPSGSRAAYKAWGWDHGNMRYSNTSHRGHTRSISSARISFQKVSFSYDQPSLIGYLCPDYSTHCHLLSTDDDVLWRQISPPLLRCLA